MSAGGYALLDVCHLYTYVKRYEGYFEMDQYRNRETFTDVLAELRLRCDHCELREDTHVGPTKKCLFDVTCFKRVVPPVSAG